MAESTFQRARSPAHKAQRREAILAAAARLAGRNGVRAVTLGDIAAEVGIHKSALLRYFETREQIFLELTARSWREWATGMAGVLEQTGRADAAGDPQAVAAALADGFVSRPLLCDLIPHTALTLERHVSLEAVRDYKHTSLGAVEAVAQATARALPSLDLTRCRELVATVALLAGGMYQISTPPPPLAQLYATEPELGHALLDLRARLQRSALVTIRGLESAGVSAVMRPGPTRGR